MEAMMMKENQISHFTHPHHVLYPVDDQSTVYTCDLCKIPGKTIRFKCTACPDFNLDPACATCKQDTTFFMHPDHIMVLLVSQDTATKIVCSVCNQDINGGHYSCCDFHVHPVCTKFPEIIKAGMSPAHADHALKGIISSDLTTCHVCRADCAGLRYRCKEGCDLDFHPSCLAGFGELMDDDDDGEGNRGSGKHFKQYMGIINLLNLVGTLLQLCEG